MDSARKHAPRYSVEGCYLVQKVRPNRARALHRSNEMQLFCESSISSEANGSWRCWRTRNVEVIRAFGRGRCVPSSASRPPLTRIYLLEEPTLTAVTKLGARVQLVARQAHDLLAVCGCTSRLPTNHLLEIV